MGKRVQGEILLPEPIIQDIQSFMSGKEAAQSSILSKSWYTAWKTGPHLYFDQRGFIRNSGDRSGENGFWEFVRKNVQRYDKLNLPIESLSLWMYGTDSDTASSYSLANKLIVEAMKLGVVDLDFCINYSDRVFELPREVLGSQTLTRLSVRGCKIGVGKKGKINCLRLKSLCLDNVWLEGDIIWDVISICPLIEKLSLFSCRFLLGTRKSKKVVSVTNFSMLGLSPFFEFGKLGSVVDGPICVYEIRKLRCLLLCGVNVHTLFFDEFSSKFPCLKDLGLHDCYGYKGIRISSPSLECINITQDDMLRVRFNVPCIRKFTFSSGQIPSLSFETSRSDWESDISIARISCPSSKWFLELNKLLTKLSMSRVSLSLKILYRNGFKYVVNIQDLPKPVVENLIVDVPSSDCPAFFDGLFQCCCPIFVTPFWLPKSMISGERKMEFLKAVYKRLIQQINLDFLDAKSNGSVLCQDDLEEVGVEVEAGSLWRRLPWELLLDYSTRLVDEQRIRFHLRWGEPADL
ncbi:hypothetical protein ACS0TY_014453 [Phlomoides rotata]